MLITIAYRVLSSSTHLHYVVLLLAVLLVSPLHPDHRTRFRLGCRKYVVYAEQDPPYPNPNLVFALHHFGNPLSFFRTVQLYQRATQNPTCLDLYPGLNLCMPDAFHIYEGVGRQRSCIAWSCFPQGRRCMDKPAVVPQAY
ncbi:hypothetical protein KC19_VG170100 [Ceratodon purpureus]|uniref:Uncharacterized protein n=1 Tax=Ceratodon purpureus TaxID=3225 RepID=A0A8T0HQZ2_CERPU|nr:hypothetical protein KC19_VG170100 [Ceratodon purpureus]